jgi:uncharacterized protein YuzE
VGLRREYNGNNIRCHQVKSARWVESMKIEYDQEADALYIQFKNILPESNRDIESGITINLDGDGHLVDLEVLDSARRFGIESVSKVSIENPSLAKSQT